MASFITVADAKAQLNITDTSQDAELQGYVDAACDMVEERVGPVATTVITGEFVDLQGRTIYNELTTAGTRGFVLRHRPVQSIQAIASAIVSGVTYTPSDFVIDSATGMIRRADWGTIFGPLTVDYTAGYTTPPAWAVLAAKVTVQSLWQTQRGPTGRRVPGADMPAASGFGPIIPPMVEFLLEPHLIVPGIG